MPMQARRSSLPAGNSHLKSDCPVQVLDILQKVFYRSNPAREAFVEMCKSDYVQKMTFDSYLYKTVVPGNPLDDVKLLVETVGSLLRGNALRQNARSVSFGSRVEPAAEKATVSA